MTAMPAGAPSFQLPRPHQGVVYADEAGNVYLMRGGEVQRIWSPPKVMRPNDMTPDGS